jgi:hypothetical protein
VDGPGLYADKFRAPSEDDLTHSRIIYVTGMKPKPPPDQHRRALVRVLSAGIARRRPDLAGWLQREPGRFVLVPWTTVLYPHHRDIRLDLPGIEQLLREPDPAAADVREINSPRRWLARQWHLIGDSSPLLTQVLASPALRQTLADVRRYIENRDGIGDRIRAVLREPLLDAWEGGYRVLLIGHSLGSVIAFDVLWELSRLELRRERIDLFISLGSPIATRFIRRGLKGAELKGRERFPGNIRRWLNVSARGETVALHPRVKPFFGAMRRAGLLESLVDRPGIYNHFKGVSGLDVHKSYGYLSHPVVAGAIAQWVLEGVGEDRR